MDSISTGEIGLLVALGIDGLIAFVSWKAFRNCSRIITDVKDAERVQIASLPEYLKEQPRNELPYAAIEGLVEPSHEAIKSRFGNAEGVIQNLTIIEHKSVRGGQSLWSDMKRTIQNVTERVPFYLYDKAHKDIKVHVEDSDQAKLLEDCLTSTHDHFTPAESGVGAKVLDLISGEVSKGIHEAEKMLLKGTQLLGLGRLTLENGQIKLSPPSGDKRFIITNLSKNGVINQYEINSRISKFFFWLSIFVGGGIVAYWIHKFYKKWRQQQYLREMRQAYDQQQREHNERAEQIRQADNAGEERSNDCIICLTNARTTVAVPCGHYCICMSCAERLPPPLSCPFCRQRVERFVPVYNP